MPGAARMAPTTVKGDSCLAIGPTPDEFVCDSPASHMVRESTVWSEAPPEGTSEQCPVECGTMPLGFWRTMRLNKFFNMLLMAATSREPDFLFRLQGLFDASTDIDGCLDIAVVLGFFSNSTWMLDIADLAVSDRKAIHVPQIRMPATSPASFTAEIMSALDVDVELTLTFPDFMLEFLGRSKHDVVLHCYDVSDGLVSNISPWAACQSIEGIWHTSVVVFGKEFYWSSVVRFEKPRETVWGDPTKEIAMGSTWFREDEFVRFIVKELHPVFTKEAYDVLSFNCNHCCDRLCMWLTGNHVPDKFLHQAQNIMEEESIEFFRPMIQRLSGV